jgi:hypothetical protein
MDCVQQLKVHRVAVFACPAGQTAAWCHGPLWDQTVASGFEAVCDPGGTESTRFGALTSGHAVVYSAEGKLQFSGGLTSTRGHVGPSAGSVALEGLLHGEAGVDRFTPTYGCEMCGPCKRNH